MVSAPFMKKTVEHQLEWRAVLQQLIVQTPYGKKAKGAMTAFLPHQLTQLQEELNELAIFVALLKQQPDLLKIFQRHLAPLKDLEGSIKRIQSAGVLTEIELFEIKGLAMDLMALKALLHQQLPPSLTAYFLHDLTELIGLLDPQELGQKSFYLYPAYSPELTRLRKAIQEREQSKGHVQELEQDQALLQLKVFEKREEARIRELLSIKINQFSTTVLENMEKVGKFDLMLAKAGLAIATNGCQPELTLEPLLHLAEARHILVEAQLSKRDRRFTPVDIHLESGTTVITGANMAGKTVVLKLVALSVAMAQHGLFVPAGQAAIGMVPNLHYLSGDGQSISQGLSSFGAEMKELAEIFSQCQANQLILLDEPARSTNPHEGFALTQAVCSYLKNRSGLTLITTHYHGIGQEQGVKHLRVAGLSKVSLKQLEQAFQEGDDPLVRVAELMDFRLEAGQGGCSVSGEALTIARIMGLPAPLIHLAAEYFSKDKEEAHGKQTQPGSSSGSTS